MKNAQPLRRAVLIHTDTRLHIHTNGANQIRAAHFQLRVARRRRRAERMIVACGIVEYFTPPARHTKEARARVSPDEQRQEVGKPIRMFSPRPLVCY